MHCAQIRAAHPQGIDILVNNAAIAFKGADPTPFGQQADPTIRINFKGTAALCDAIIPLIRNGGRITTVSSMSGSLRNYSPTCVSCLLLSLSLLQLQLSYNYKIHEYTHIKNKNTHT